MEGRFRKEGLTSFNAKLDPRVRALAEKYFRTIQAVHHKAVMERALLNRTTPTGMAKKVKKLSDFIQPAGPTQEVMHKISHH